MSDPKQFDIIIGSYSDGKELPSVYRYKDSNKNIETVLSAINPSYIFRHEGYYYIASEKQNGQIITLSPDFKILSRVKTLGDDPCHINIDNTGSFLVATNYSSQSTIIWKLQNHIPSVIHSVIKYEGSSTHPIGPVKDIISHPHSSAFSEDNKTLFIADKGSDIVYYYDFTMDNVKWIKEKSLKITGAGPRSIIRGRSGTKSLYLSCQLDNTVRILSYKGTGLEQLAAYKMSDNPNNFPSSVQYVNNQIFVALRGDDKIVVFNEKDDKLTPYISFKVAIWPRQFVVTQDGYLFVAGQNANLVQKYQITSQKVTRLNEIKINTPSCIVII